MTALGVTHQVVIKTVRESAKIFIGSDTGISGGTICAAGSIEIGKGCLIGADVTIMDTDFHSLLPRGRRFNANWSEIGVSPVVIEDNVFIGAGSYVLKGVRIGENSVIGAGSVVIKSVPPNTIYAGNPAKFIRKL
jgi:acetyltransferase-like isoleucine patch superfamily enzyme